QPADFAIKSVAPDGIRKIVVVPIGVTRLVRKRIELEVSGGNRTDPILRNDVVGNRLAQDARALRYAAVRIEDLVAVEARLRHATIAARYLQQSREIAIALSLGGNGSCEGLRE